MFSHLNMPFSPRAYMEEKVTVSPDCHSWNTGCIMDKMKGSKIHKDYDTLL